MTGQLKAIDGAANAPAYAFGSALDYGMYYASSQLKFAAGSGGSSTFVMSGTGSYLGTGSGAWFPVNGNTSSPALSFYTDQDTGISNPSTNNLSLVTGGTERVRVDSSGNVGIGTTTPYYRLQVLGAVNSTTSPFNATFTDSASYAADVGGGLSFGGYYNGSSTSNFAGIRGGKENGTSGNSAGYLALYTHPDGGDPTERVRIDSTGNVGIGTTSPTAALSVRGDGILMLKGADPTAPVSAPFLTAPVATGYSSEPVYSFWYQDSLGISNPANNEIAVVTTNSERLRIDSSGNVGIGTTAPGAKLQVVGEVRTTDSSGNGRLWGQGRPGATRYGTSGVNSGLCTNGSITFGLSYIAVSWEGAAAACPVGTWVCTAAERGSGSCDTARPDSTVDGVNAAGATLNQNANNHIAWVADVGSATTTATAIGENGTTYDTTFPSNNYAVWCCN
jgi:hypothetical protein